MTWVSILFGSGGAIALAAAVATGAGSPEDAFGRAAPQPLVEEASPAPAPAIRVPRARDGLFYLYAQINGQPVRFLVDTGASVTILTPGDAARVGASAKAGAPLRLRTASGHGTMRWAEMRTLDLGHQQLRHLDAAIGDRHLPVSLLGQNVLTRLESVQISGNALHLN